MNLSPAVVLKISGSIATAVVACGCSSPLNQRAQRADGLLGFIFDSPGADIVPVERVSKAGGHIATAHATPAGTQLRVSGLVRKASLPQPPLGSHIDVFVLDARANTTAAVATDYFPRPIPREHSRGGRGNAHYTTRFPFIPPAGSTVRVVFHGSSKTKCELSAGT